MKKVDKPWGYELIWAHTDNYVGKVLHIENGFSLSLQYHKVKEETIMVKKGVLTLEVGGEENRNFLTLGEGDVYHIQPGLIHRMSALHGEVDVFEVSTPELDDVIRLADNYGRV